MDDAEMGLKNKGKVRRKHKGIMRFLVFLLIVGLTVASCYISYNYIIEKSKTILMGEKVVVDPEKAVHVEIPKGAGTETIASILVEQGLIKNTLVFKLLSMVNGFDGAYQSGTHLVGEGLKYEEIMRILTDKPEMIKITIPEGYNIKQIANTLLKNKLIKSTDEFLKTADKEKFDYPFLKNVPQRTNRLEGYLFPDTYLIDLGAGEKEILDMFLRNFNNKFISDYSKKAEAMKMTVDQIVTLASIIEREAQRADERSLISGVFYNRLNNKDKTLRRLQSCATIQYIFFMRQGIIKEEINEADTKVDSPYNTYTIEGLPPGPICSPGEAAITAALSPEKTDYLYFVARGDGTHQFSKTFKEHQAAVQKYGLN